MRTIVKGVILGLVLEGLAFLPLLFGRWGFMGEIDWLGSVGLLLHYPGFWASRHLPLEGNLTWIAIVGVPLILWCILATLLVRILRPVRRIA